MTSARSKLKFSSSWPGASSWSPWIMSRPIFWEYSITLWMTGWNSRELVDVVAVGLRQALDRRRAVVVQLEPHHLGLEAGAQVHAGLAPRAPPAGALEVAAAVGREERGRVLDVLAAAEQGAEDARDLGIPGQRHERLGLRDADELGGLRAVADVLAVAVDEQVGGRAVDELEALAGDRLPVRRRARPCP